jgi:hypothetical protein
VVDNEPRWDPRTLPILSSVLSCQLSKWKEETVRL